MTATAARGLEGVRPEAGVTTRLRSLRFVLAVWTLSRLWFMLTGALGSAFVVNAWHANVYRFTPPGALSYWASWDGAWYEAIAQHGYADTASTAYFPLYPLLMRAGMEIGLPPSVAGVVISLAAFLAALFFIYELAVDIFDERVARASTLALAFFPTAFYFNAVYSESLFLALTAGALWAVRVRGNFLVGLVLGYGATLTRNAGVLIVIPFAAELFRRRREVGWVGVGLAAIVPCGLFAYMFYLWGRWRNALLFSFVEREKWSRTLRNPLDTLAASWRTARDSSAAFVHVDGMFAGTQSNPALIGSNTLGFACLALAAILVAFGLMKLPPVYWLYAFALVALPLLTPVPGFPLMGFPRYLVVAFPLFWVVGTFLARSRALLAVWLVAEACIGVYLTVMFVTWRWVA
jgi:hypothetical protein